MNQSVKARQKQRSLMISKYKPVFTAKPKVKVRRTPVVEEITFPSVQWILDDWGRWFRALPEFSDNFEQLDFSDDPAEAWFISDDDAFKLEQTIKELDKYNGFIESCICRYYLGRNMTTRELASSKNISETRLRGALRAGETWIHSRACDWIDPLYQKHLTWETEKKRRRAVVENVVDGLRAQKV